MLGEMAVSLVRISAFTIVSEHFKFSISKNRSNSIDFSSVPDHALSLGCLSSQHRATLIMMEAATLWVVRGRERHGERKQDHWPPTCPGVD